MFKKNARWILFALALVWPLPAAAQYYGGAPYGAYGSTYGFNNGLAYQGGCVGGSLCYFDPYFNAGYSTSQKVGLGIAQGFDTLFMTLNEMANHKAIEANLQARHDHLENLKMQRRFYEQQGYPPFATHGPSGAPRPKSITWSDVQSID